MKGLSSKGLSSKGFAAAVVVAAVVAGAVVATVSTHPEDVHAGWVNRHSHAEVAVARIAAIADRHLAVPGGSQPTVGPTVIFSDAGGYVDIELPGVVLTPTVVDRGLRLLDELMEQSSDLGISHVLHRQQAHYPGGRIAALADRGDATANYFDRVRVIVDENGGHR